MDKLVNIGRIRKPHGIDGVVMVLVEDAFLESFFGCEVVFIDLRGGQVPFFVEGIGPGNDLSLKLEDVDSREEAVELSGKALFLREQDILEGDREGERPNDFRRFAGFTIIDKTAGRVGVIEEVIELPQQWMAVVSYRRREVLIPLNELLITGIRESQKLLEMDLPEGILEL